MMTDQSRPTILSVRSITKDFPGLRALDHVSMQVRAGEILALLGQNGSGKSTLVKVLAGLYTPDSGEVTVHRKSSDASDVLHFIHQDLGLIGGLSTVENLAIGRRQAAPLRPLRHGLERDHAVALIARFGADFDVRKQIGRLTPAQRSIVAIARAMDDWTDPHGVLVLDEPTAALHGEEVGVLFTAVREAARAGAGVVFISHRLDEVLELADRVVVLRDGQLVADEAVPGLSTDRLAELIVGRRLTSGHPSQQRAAGQQEPPTLSVRGLSGGTLRPLDLNIWPGEVVGVAGSLGSGREELAGLIFGALPRQGGHVSVVGEPVPGSAPRDSIRAGIAFVPADRHAQGAVMTHDVVDNVMLTDLESIAVGRIHLSKRKEFAEAQTWAERVGVAPNLPRRPLRLFSGGNQQKVVVARWLRTRPTVLMLDEPTQGVDVGSSESIRALVMDAAMHGAAVLVSSSDNADLLRMCSRVLILRDGAVTTELHGDALTDHRLTKECLGVGTNDPVSAGNEK